MSKKIFIFAVILIMILSFNNSLFSMNKASSNSPSNNLVINPSFEDGNDKPDNWTIFPHNNPNIIYKLDSNKKYSGKRSAYIESTSTSFGMWQQIVKVKEDKVYSFSGFVAFSSMKPPSNCKLQLVFRDKANKVLQFVNYPSHSGERNFELDFPYVLKVRAPINSEKAEVNLFIEGVGKAWFDDIYFGESELGYIAGVVRDSTGPIKDAKITIYGNPYGKKYETISNSKGKYKFNEVICAFPRYILIANKDGYKTKAKGNIDIKPNFKTIVDFILEKGTDPVDPNLRIKFGTIEYSKFLKGNTIPKESKIPASKDDYPEDVRIYLKSDEFIKSDDPNIKLFALELLNTLPETNRNDTRKIVWALYERVCKNIDHDGVFSDPPRGLDQPYKDVTSGIWQTISGEGWCFGKNFYDWCYKGNDLLKVRCGICVEHAWFVTTVLRALNIPARASIGSNEFWAQNEKEGRWVHMSTTGGRTTYRQSGILGNGFEGLPPLSRYSVTSKPVLHEDWNAENKLLWREVHPFRELYSGTEEGLKRAKMDLDEFSLTGRAPRGNKPDFGKDIYQIHYSDVTINLYNIGNQKILDVRFPLTTDNLNYQSANYHKFWTNHPECIVRTYIEEVKEPTISEIERWFHIEFNIEKLVS